MFVHLYRKNESTVSMSVLSKGPSIKYVTLFWPILTLLPPVTLCHTPRDPPKVHHTSRNPQFFSRPSTKILDKSPLYKFSLNSAGVLVRGVCQRSFVWKILSGVVFVHSPFCQKFRTH